MVPIGFALLIREIPVSVVEPMISCEQQFQDLLRASPGQLAFRDIAEMNLLCAHGLPGAENMDVRTYLRILGHWTKAIQERCQRLLPHFRANPESVGIPVG